LAGKDLMKILITDPGTVLPVVVDREITTEQAEIIATFLDSSLPQGVSLLKTSDLQIIRGVFGAAQNAEIDGGLMVDEIDLLDRITRELERREVIDR
jgi:hypothetical protein